MWIVSRPLHPGEELARLLVLQSSTCWRRAQGAFRGFLFQDCCHDTPWRSTVQHSVQRSQVITGCCPLVAPKNSLKVNQLFFCVMLVSLLSPYCCSDATKTQYEPVWAIPLVCSFENLRHPAKNMETHPKHPKHPTTYILPTCQSVLWNPKGESRRIKENLWLLRSWGCSGGPFRLSICWRLRRCWRFLHCMPLWWPRAKRGLVATTMCAPQTSKAKQS